MKVCQENREGRGGDKGETEKAGTAQPAQIPHSKGILCTFLHIKYTTIQSCKKSSLHTEVIYAYFIPEEENRMHTPILAALEGPVNQCYINKKRPAPFISVYLHIHGHTYSGPRKRCQAN